MVATFAAPLLWLLALPDTWWAWGLFAVIMLFALVFSGIGIYQTFRPPEDDPPEDDDQSGAGAD